MALSQRHNSADAEAGSATVEAAFAFATLVVVLLLALAAFAVAIAKVHTVDAASAGARLAGRGDHTWSQVAASLAPAGAEISRDDTADAVRVTVTVEGVSVLPITISSSATAAKEPGFD